MGCIVGLLRLIAQATFTLGAAFVIALIAGIILYAIAGVVVFVFFAIVS